MSHRDMVSHCFDMRNGLHGMMEMCKNALGIPMEVLPADM